MKTLQTCICRGTWGRGTRGLRQDPVTMMMFTKRLWSLRSSNLRPSLIFQEALVARHCSLHTGLRRNIYEEKYFFVSISNSEFIIDQSYNFSRVLWIDLVKLPNKTKLKKLSKRGTCQGVSVVGFEARVLMLLRGNILTICSRRQKLCSLFRNVMTPACHLPLQRQPGYNRQNQRICCEPFACYVIWKLINKSKRSKPFFWKHGKRLEEGLETNRRKLILS